MLKYISTNNYEKKLTYFIMETLLRFVFVPIAIFRPCTVKW